MKCPREFNTHDAATKAMFKEIDDCFAGESITSRSNEKFIIEHYNNNDKTLFVWSLKEGRTRCLPIWVFKRFRDKTSAVMAVL